MADPQVAPPPFLSLSLSFRGLIEHASRVRMDVFKIPPGPVHNATALPSNMATPAASHSLEGQTHGPAAIVWGASSPPSVLQQRTGGERRKR